MNVTIQPHLQKFIEEQIRAGNYSTPDAIINSALARLQESIEFSPEDLEDLKREIAVGVEQADRGEFVEFTAEDIIREGREILARQQKAV